MPNKRILKKLTLLLVLMISSALAWGSQKKTSAPPPKPAPQVKTAPAAKPTPAPSQPAAQQQRQPQGHVGFSGGTGKPAGATSKPMPTVRPDPTVKAVASRNTNNTKKTDRTKKIDKTTRIDDTKKKDDTKNKDDSKKKDDTKDKDKPANGKDGLTTENRRLKDGTLARVSVHSNGKISDIQARGMTIHKGVRGGRTIVSERNGRTLVSTGPHSGYVQHPPFSRGGREYVQRDYVVGGRHYTRVYRDYYYGRAHYYIYAPAYYYHPAFYGWAYNRWAARVYYNWGWGRAPWFYGGYFAPAPYYPTASLWLTDYLLAANLKAAYESGTPAEQYEAQESGLAFVPVLADGTRNLAPGFAAAGTFDFAGDRLILHGGATATFSLSVPAGQAQTVAYGIPTGSYLNNTPAEVSVNGVTVATINQSAGLGSATPTQVLLWRKSFGPGDHVVTIRSGGLVNFYGLWLGQESTGEHAAPPESESATATPMSPGVKGLVDTEVQRQLQAEQAATQSPQAQPANDQAPPPALDPTQSVFVVSSSLGVSTAGGQECELTAGDVLTRIDDAPDNDGTVGVRVMSSKANDCSVGSKPRIAVNDLQEMNNTFREQLDSGLKALADKSGTGGLPKAPDTKTSAGEVQQPTPDTSVDNELKTQQTEANQLEAQVR